MLELFRELEAIKMIPILCSVVVIVDAYTYPQWMQIYFIFAFPAFGSVRWRISNLQIFLAVIQMEGIHGSKVLILFFIKAYRSIIKGNFICCDGIWFSILLLNHSTQSLSFYLFLWAAFTLRTRAFKVSGRWRLRRPPTRTSWTSRLNIEFIELDTFFVNIVLIAIALAYRPRRCFFIRTLLLCCSFLFRIWILFRALALIFAFLL